MKKILLVIFSILIMSSTIQAQETTNYLAKAFELLLEGNIESAEKHYIVHKKTTGQTDAEFEAMLENEKSTTAAWKDECYIVDFNNEYALAIQKKSISQKVYTWYVAKRKAKDSRMGGFIDWRLPTMEELSVILANTDIIPCYRDRYGNSYERDNKYWTTSCTEESYEEKKTIKKLEWLEKKHKDCSKVERFHVSLLNCAGLRFFVSLYRVTYSNGVVDESPEGANYIVVRKFKK